MPQQDWISQTERAAATAEQELASRRLAGVNRFLQRSDLSDAARRAATYLRDELSDEVSMSSILTYQVQPSRWTMARYASPSDSLDERPYQQGGH